MEENLDYATVLETTDPTRRIVALMRYDKSQDGYVIAWCSSRVSEKVALLMVQSVAKARGVEVR